MKSKIGAISLLLVLTACVTVDRAPKFKNIEYSSSQIEKIRAAAFIKPTKRQLEWQKLEFTAFFHFGINTFTNREWGYGNEDPELFQPSKLDCEQWAKTCKDSGIKLAIITAKHHDGFCLWPSKYTEHDVESTSWRNGKGDVVGDFVKACRKYDIKIGIYLSPWDRHEKTYGSDAYNDYFVNQIDEILSTYGPVDEFWFDGACGEGPNGKKQQYDWNRYYKRIREYNNDTVIAISGPDVRWVGNEDGLARESEWSVVPSASLNQDLVKEGFEDFHFEDISEQTLDKMDISMPIIKWYSDELGSREELLAADSLVWYPAECDVSIRPGWFYHKAEDKLVKSLDRLLEIYYKSIGRNSVLLLNIPPNREGLVHQNDVARLKEFKTAIDSTFSNNFLHAEDVVIKIDNINIKELNDGDYSTIWKAEKSSVINSVEIELNKPMLVDRAMIQENIATGQRVEYVSLEYYAFGMWHQAASVTTVGYKRLIRFKPIKAQKFRFIFKKQRAEIEINELGLYKSSLGLF